MQLPNPITIKLPNGREQTLAELPVTIVDSKPLRRVQVMLRPLMKPLILWQGDAYDAAGDYTQAQVEARVLELLGSDIKARLEALFVAGIKT
jgi:hypothetical protein